MGMTRELAETILRSGSALDFRNAISGDFSTVAEYFAGVSHYPVWDLIPYLGRRPGRLVSLQYLQPNSHAKGGEKTEMAERVNTEGVALETYYLRRDLPRMGVEDYDSRLLDYVTRFAVEGLQYGIIERLFDGSGDFWSIGASDELIPGGYVIGSAEALQSLLNGMSLETFLAVHGYSSLINPNVTGMPSDRVAVVSPHALARVGDEAPGVFVSSFNHDGSPRNERQLICELTYAFLIDPKGVGYIYV